MSNAKEYRRATKIDPEGKLSAQDTRAAVVLELLKGLSEPLMAILAHIEPDVKLALTVQFEPEHIGSKELNEDGETRYMGLKMTTTIIDPDNFMELDKLVKFIVDERSDGAGEQVLDYIDGAYQRMMTDDEETIH